MARQRLTQGLLFGAIAAIACSWTATSFAAQADTTAPTPPPASATLEVNSGGVMLSNGQQPFQTVASGQPVIEGERLMVTQGGSATVVYGNNCTRTFTQPGVYTIPGSCTPDPVATTDSATGGSGGGLATLAVLGGVAVIAALNPNNGGDNNPPSTPPVSH